MRYAVVSDIHANLEALKAVLKEINKENIDRILCLGDIVGYGANPNECVELIREHSFNIILGNHDRVVIGADSGEGFTDEARQAIIWTKNTLEEKHIKFLSKLPNAQGVGNLLFLVHGSPVNKDEYLNYKYQAQTSLEHLGKHKPDVKICFFGHTHKQALWYRRDDGTIFNPSLKMTSLAVNMDFSYLINPGSVGQSRGQGTKACYCIYDTDKNTVIFNKIDYNYKAAAKKILKAGLPAYLAERLKKGL